MTSAGSRVWLWYLGLGVLVLVVQLALPVGPARELLFVLVGASAVVATLVGIRVYRPRSPLAWYLMAAGMAFWVSGDVLWGVFDHVLGIDPFPSFADVLYLTGYPFLAAGLFQLSRRALAGRNLAAVIDALIVATGLALVLWVVFIQPTWTDAEGDLLTRVVGVAYPVLDVVLVTQLVHMGASTLVRTTALRLLGGAFLTVLAADLLFQAVAYLPQLEARAHWIDAGWIIAYLLWGSAALHPSMASRMSVSGTDRFGGTRRMVFLAFAVMVLPVTLLVEHALRQPAHIVEVALAAVVIVALVALRTIGLVRRLREQSGHLELLADTDFVTGVENPRRVSERVDDLLTRAPPTPVALLAVSVERFAEINETLGARTGDEILRAVAGRLERVVGDRGTVGRVTGGGFGIVVPRLAAEAEADRFAASLRAAFDEPVAVAEVTVSVDVTIGIALGPVDGATTEELHQRVDTALSAAAERPERIARYAQRMDATWTHAPQLMAELEQALTAGDVVVHYQPQVEVLTGRVLGVEALVRWQHPVHGTIPPVAFVPAAERTGLIRLLTLYVLDRSLAQCATWREEGINLTVAVNLSVRNLLDPGFVAAVRAALRHHHLPASCLELEITETMSMVDPVRSLEVLTDLDRLGVALSVDDYGTGHSSLAYLQRLPLRRLKIDRSFVMGVVDDVASAAIVRSTIELARHLGLSVVAEGVEDDATLLALAEMRCFAAQGFGLARPAPAEQIPGLVAGIEARVPTVLGIGVPQPSLPRDRPVRAAVKPAGP
ncbi:GGDEF domain-containing protein [Actinotalea sp. BY-33]|uniref:GGDEF domain-containing protein n=1 Tax=Actinotalea soli TaxID=2819234 RepID=A0A939LQJ0_9CELL|nr:bifunctional diguanylate cyclase/phosphodiesterase [Actinotalea soli]MBO1752646.1 GGDEF domain-containing protein [Actinotalea soli]